MRGENLRNPTQDDEVEIFWVTLQMSVLMDSE